jgi:WD40 repeat protein
MAARPDELLAAAPGFGALLDAHTGGGVAGLLAACTDAASWRLVAEAVRLGAHALTDHPERLAPQLVGRLAGTTDPVAAAIAGQASAWRGAGWLCPAGGSLTPPGGPLLTTLPATRQSSQPVALTPDGRTVLAGDGDLVRLWDLATLAGSGVLEGHDSSVLALALAPDGRWAVTGSSDETVRLWDLERGQAWGVLEGHSDWVRAVAATADCRLAVSGADDRTVRVWDLEHRAPVGVLEGHTGWVKAVAISPDGRLALSGGDDETVRLWDLVELRQLAEYDADVPVGAVAFLPSSGRVLAAAGVDTLVLRDDDLSQMASLAGHTDWVRALAVSADEGTLVSGSDDGTVRVWDLAELAPTQVVQHGDWVKAVALAPDAGRVVSAARDGTVKVWRLDRAPWAAHWTARPAIGLLAVTPDGGRALTGGSSGGVRVWDLRTGTALAAFPDPGTVTALAVSGDGRRALAGLLGGARMIDLAHLAVLDGQVGPMPLPAPAQPTAAATPDGAVAVTIDSTGTLRVWRPADLEVASTLDGHLGRVTQLAIDPAGLRAAGAAGCTVRLWDLAGAGPRTLAEFVADQAVAAIALPGAGGLDLVAGDVGGALHRLRLVSP